MGILDKFTKKKDAKVEEASSKKASVAKTAKEKKPAAAAKKEASKKKATPKSASAKTSFAAETQGVIIYPLVTEKTASLTAIDQYVFVVRTDANRIEVRNAVRAMYGVTPVSVNIQKVKGKKVRFGRKFGRRKDWKKAIVTLPKGKSIEVYE